MVVSVWVLKGLIELVRVGHVKVEGLGFRVLRFTLNLNPKP